MKFFMLYNFICLFSLGQSLKLSLNYGVIKSDNHRTLFPNPQYFTVFNRKYSLSMHGGHHHKHLHTHEKQIIPNNREMIASNPSLPLDHNHSHDHDHDHSHEHQSKSPLLSNKFRILIASLLVILPSVIRRRITRLDVGIFMVVATMFTMLNSAKSFVYEWIAKMRTLKNSLWKHSTPISRQYLFKNVTAADRVTLLGIIINIILSISKFVGGVACHSAVLVADAGHSLSDLFSDFITLWAVQVARLPADDDHPYGHGKFESIGSLFLSLTLIGAGLSVGSWSYDKFFHLIMASRKLSSSEGLSTADIPTWPALVLAVISILSKEWLFRITKSVGQLLNSQILIANAWHHRSDAFSSILSLISIAFAILLPQFVYVDAAGGILVAGMICFSGLEILFESIKQLSDTSNDSLIPEVTRLSLDVEGVLGVNNIRTRSVGSGDVIDLTIFTDQKITASSSQAIAEQVRWKIIQSIPSVIEVTARARFIEPICPLLTQRVRSVNQVDREIRSYVSKDDPSLTGIKSIDRVLIHYVNTVQITAEVIVRVDPSLSLPEAMKVADRLRQKIMRASDIIQAEVLVNLTPSSTDLDIQANTPFSIPVPDKVNI